VIALLPTFLHELAHVSTRTSLKNLDGEYPTENVISNAPVTKWEKQISCAHTDEFYEHFANILRTAEALGIYSLPPIADKYSRRSLKRFDAIDAVALSIEIGSSQLLETKYSHLLGPLNKSLELRLIVRSSSGTTKLIVIKERTLQDLFKAANQKLRIKAKKAVVVKTNQVVTNDVLEILKEDEILLIQ